MLAREHGFDSWPKFVKHLEAVESRRHHQPAAGQVIQLQVPTHREVNLGVFLPDPRRMLTATEAEPVRLWDLAGGTCVRQFGEYSTHAWALKAVAGRSVLIGCRDGAVRLVDLDNGGVAKTLTGHRGFVRCLDAHTATIRSVTWSPDQRLVLSAAHDRTVRVWDVDTGACRRVFAGHAAGAIDAV